MRKFSFCILILFLSAASSFAQTYPKSYRKAMSEARDKTRNIFIELNNGTILTFQKLKIKAGFMQYEHFEGDGKNLDISFDSVRCFQTEDYYAARKHTSPTIKIGKIPSSELFAKRVKQGKIELFFSYQQYDEDSKSFGERSNYFFVRKGDSTLPIYAGFFFTELSTMLLDNPTVSSEFNSMSLRKKRDLDNLLEILESYNTSK